MRVSSPEGTRASRGGSADDNKQFLCGKLFVYSHCSFTFPLFSKKYSISQFRILFATFYIIKQKYVRNADVILMVATSDLQISLFYWNSFNFKNCIISDQRIRKIQMKFIRILSQFTNFYVLFLNNFQADFFPLSHVTHLRKIKPTWVLKERKY